MNSVLKRKPSAASSVRLQRAAGHHPYGQRDGIPSLNNALGIVS